MRKILFLLVIVGLASINFAGNLFTSTLPSPFEQKVAYSSLTKDTLGAADSQTIYTKWTPGAATGKYFYLVNNVITGTGSDSIRGFFYSDEYNSNDSLLGRILIDSLKTYLLSPVILPISNGLPGSKHTIKWITTTGSGSQIITNGWNIIECKPIK